jgi:uncharacterized protein
MDTRKTIIISASILAGLFLSALLIGRAIQRFNQEDRTISVKGFAEREVKSDLSVWTIRTRIANDDLNEGSKAIELSKNKVIDFLLKNNITPEEIVQKDLIVNDKKAQEYGNFNDGKSFRFLIDKVIQVRSTNVDNIQRVSRMTDELLKAGVVITNANGNEGPVRFYFTKLNEIKPAMLTEATINARNAAMQFAKESDVALGKLKRASQGLFSIMDRDEFLASQANSGYYPGSGSDPVKKVRVVVSIDYSVR